MPRVSLKNLPIDELAERIRKEAAILASMCDRILRRDGVCESLKEELPTVLGNCQLFMRINLSVFDAAELVRFHRSVKTTQTAVGQWGRWLEYKRDPH